MCFISACRRGADLMGPHMHPSIVMSAIPMGLSMPGWESDNHEEVAEYLSAGVNEVHNSGADFFICPDNTAHIILEKIIDELPIPGLNIADVVCHEIIKNGWQKVALLGTKWTMIGPVYKRALQQCGLTKLIPPATVRTQINDLIFSDLCQGIFKQQTTSVFIKAIEELKSQGAECVILGCTEIPLIINSENSPLPILDSTRSVARYAVDCALSDQKLPEKGWITPS